VAQINSHEWAITARGFNNQFANKLLVLVDGRSVYGTGFGGVVWGVQDLVMEDLDRIEVIRGPGGTLWGANAVNGVINIITKSAKETQGLLVSATGGTQEQPNTTLRYGGRLGTNLFYRAYVKYFNRDGFVLSNGEDAPDSAREIQGGARVDWEPREESRLTVQGDYYADRFVENHELPILTPPYVSNLDTINHNSGGNVLARWTRNFSDSSSLTLQAYYDYFVQEQAQARQVAHTIDFDAQHRFALGSRHDLVWGLGYRYLKDQFTPSSFVSWNPAGYGQQLFSAFLQDEITLLPERFKLTLGSKFERNDFTGFEIQPSARLLWTPTARQTVWAAVSRAVRTPSRTDLHSRANYGVIPPGVPPYFSPLPVLVSLFGNPNLRSEVLLAYEFGYRVELTRRLSLDAAAFYNDYDRLIEPVTGGVVPVEFDPPPMHTLVPNTTQNAGAAHTYGVELAARWNVTDRWHLAASYSWLETRLKSGSTTYSASPQQQFQLRSSLNLPGNLEFNGAISFVDQITVARGLGSMNIPSYVRLDLGMVWHPTKRLELGVWGQNLLDDRHPEFSSYKTSVITEIPRSVVGKITWRF